jgi:hypothetical protein
VALFEPAPIDLSDASSQNGRRDGKRRRDSRQVMYVPTETLTLDNGAAQAESDDGQDRRAGRADRRAEAKRSRTPRMSRSTKRTFGDETKVVESEGAADANGNGSAAPLPVLDLKGRGSARTAARVQKRQEAAASAIDELDGDAALGAINRHLNVLTQQVTAAHRVLGRVAAERDALRQQVADLQGIPVEEVIVSNIAATNGTSAPARHESHAELEPHERSRMEKLNYFGGDDFELMRKRRQIFVLSLAIIGGFLAMVARQMGWSFPDDISRDSLSALPFLGNLMTVFLAGWVFYRVVRVASKGVRWVFPAEHRARRRH